MRGLRATPLRKEEEEEEPPRPVQGRRAGAGRGCAACRRRAPRSQPEPRAAILGPAEGEEEEDPARPGVQRAGRGGK